MAVYWQVQREREAAVAKAYHQLRYIVDEVADQQVHVADFAEQLLRSLAANPAVAQAREPDCQRILAQAVAERSDHFTHLLVLGLGGEVLCSDSPLKPFRHKELPAFGAALRSHRAAIGTVLRGPTSGRPVLPLFLAMRDQNGVPTGLLLAGLDLSWLHEVGRKGGLPADAVIAVLDQSQRLLVRHPDLEGLTGQVLSGTPLGQALAAGGTSSLIETEGADGRHRLFAQAHFESVEAGELTVGVSAPVDTVLSQMPNAGWQVGRVTLLMFLVLAALLLLASERLILRPVERMTQAFGRLAKGDLTQVGATGAVGEVGELAGLFDEAVSSLASLGQLVRSNRALRVLVAVKGLRTAQEHEIALFAEVCAAVAKSGAYSTVAYSRLLGELDATLEVVAVEGLGEAIVRGQRCSAKDDGSQASLTGTAVRERRPIAMNEASSDSVPEPWRQLAQTIGAASAIAVPLLQDSGEVMGCVTIYSRESNEFGELETALLGEVASDIVAKVAMLRDRRARQEAQDALIASESTLARAEELGATGSWSMDFATRRVVPSAQLLSIAALARSDFSGTLQALLDMVHPGEREWVGRAFADAVAAGTTYDVQHRLMAANGRQVMVHSRAVTVCDAAGSATHLVGTVRDITEESAIRTALRERVKEMKCLNRVFAATDQSGTPVEAMFQATVDALVVSWLFADATARICFGDLRIQTPDFAETPWQLRADFTAWGRHGEVMVAYQTDHTEELPDVFMPEEAELLAAVAKRLAESLEARAAQDRIRDREHLYSAIFGQARDAIILVDMATGRFSDFNEVAHRSLGYSAGEFAELSIGALDAALSPAQLQAAVEAMMQPEGAVVETKLRCADGSLRDVRVSARPIHVSGRQFLAAMLVDLTADKKVEAELRRMSADQQMIAAATREMLFATDELALMKAVCEVLVSQRGYSLAWVGLVQEDAAGTVLPVAHSGPSEYVTRLDIAYRDPVRGAGPTGRCVRERKPMVVRQIAEDGAFLPWRDAALAAGLESAVAIPLLTVDGALLAVISIYSPQVDGFADDETTLLYSLVNSMAFAVSALRDRQAREVAEAEIRKLSLVVEQSPSSVLVTNLNAEIEYVNDAFCRTTGYTRAEAIGSNPRLLKSGLVPVQVYQEMWATLTRGEFWSGELVNRRKNGQLFVELATILPLRDVRGTVINYVAVKEDITERKAAEDQLRKLSLAVEQSPTSIAITNLDASIEYVNPAFLKQTGYTQEELHGQNPRALQSGKTPPAVYQEMWGELREGRTWIGEFINKRKDGSEYIERATLAPIRRDDGTVSHYLAIKEDITEAKRLGDELEAYRLHLEDLVDTRTEQLREAQRRAEAANTAKSAFLANMSHEIRTPLNAIIGLTHLLSEQISDPGQIKRLGKVSGSARHLLNIINDILDLSKVEAGKVQIEAVDFAVDELIQKVHDNLGDRAREKGLELRFDVDPRLPESVRADELRVSQVLLNLTTNAIKFTAKGHVEVRVRLAHELAGADLIRFEVEDSGIGLTDEQIARLFQPFEQADVSTTRQYGGTGLGLAISRQLVGLMGGEIGVASKPGSGSTFWFQLPLELARSPVESDIDMPQATQAKVLAPRPPASVQVLVVEDDPINQEVACEQLTNEGFRVRLAENGAVALELAKVTRFDLVLMDVQMPVMDGLTATRALRQLPGYRNAPILAMTASVFADDRRACLDAGMDDVVFKPFNPMEFLAKVCRWTGAVLGKRTDGQGSGLLAKIPLQWQGLVKIAGLDPLAGVAALAGNWRSYARLLHSFARDRRGEGGQLRAMAEHRQLRDLKYAAHRLKGVAGTLGALALRDAALQVEHIVLAQDPTDSALVGAVAELARLQDALVADIEAHVSQSTVTVVPDVDWSQVRSVASELELLLANGDFRAQTVVRASESLLRAAMGDHYGPFAQEMESFRFEEALQRLSDWLRSAPGQAG